jgi:hypothetical protein
MQTIKTTDYADSTDINFLKIFCEICGFSIITLCSLCLCGFTKKTL